MFYRETFLLASGGRSDDRILLLNKKEKGGEDKSPCSVGIGAVEFDPERLLTR